MRVSVILPCYNGARFMRESIESVLAQSRPADEVLLVDDGSTDDSAAIAAGFPGVRVVRQANQGVSGARNTGIAQASGDVIAFQDVDDRLLPNAIEIGLRALAERPDCAFVYGWSRTIRHDGTAVPQPARPRVSDAGYRRMLGGDTLVPPASALFRRTAFDAVGGFRSEHEPAEDYDFYLRVTQRFPVYCHNEIIVEYRRHAENVSGASPSRSLRAVWKALEAQRAEAGTDPTVAAAIDAGRRHWALIFGPWLGFEMIDQLRRGRIRAAAATGLLAAQHHPRGLSDVTLHYARRALARRTR